MKTILFGLLFVSSALLTHGQNLTIDELSSLRKKSIDQIEEYLTAKNWKMIRAEEATEDRRANLCFAFNKSIYDNQAEAFIYFFSSATSATFNRIGIQIHKLSTYNTFVTRIKALGYKLKKSEIENGGIKKLYENYDYTIEVRTDIDKEDTITKTTYFIVLYNRIDYAVNMH